ncbi:MAG: hypothetical protein AB7F43_13955 [Bacteriovoracia bacterium]
MKSKLFKNIVVLALGLVAIAANAGISGSNYEDFRPSVAVDQSSDDLIANQSNLLIQTSQIIERFLQSADLSSDQSRFMEIYKLHYPNAQAIYEELTNMLDALRKSRLSPAEKQRLTEIAQRALSYFDRISGMFERYEQSLAAHLDQRNQGYCEQSQYAANPINSGNIKQIAALVQVIHQESHKLADLRDKKINSAPDLKLAHSMDDAESFADQYILLANDPQRQAQAVEAVQRIVNSYSGPRNVSFDTILSELSDAKLREQMRWDEDTNVGFSRELVANLVQVPLCENIRLPLKEADVRDFAKLWNQFKTIAQTQKDGSQCIAAMKVFLEPPLQEMYSLAKSPEKKAILSAFQSRVAELDMLVRIGEAYQLDLADQQRGVNKYTKAEITQSYLEACVTQHTNIFLRKGAFLVEAAVIGYGEQAEARATEVIGRIRARYYPVCKGFLAQFDVPEEVKQVVQYQNGAELQNELLAKYFPGSRITEMQVRQPDGSTSSTKSVELNDPVHEWEMFLSRIENNPEDKARWEKAFSKDDLAKRRKLVNLYKSVGIELARWEQGLKNAPRYSHYFQGFRVGNPVKGLLSQGMFDSFFDTFSFLGLEKLKGSMGYTDAEILASASELKKDANFYKKLDGHSAVRQMDQARLNLLKIIEEGRSLGMPSGTIQQIASAMQSLTQAEGQNIEQNLAVIDQLRKNLNRELWLAPATSLGISTLGNLAVKAGYALKNAETGYRFLSPLGKSLSLGGQALALGSPIANAAKVNLLWSGGEGLAKLTLRAMFSPNDEHQAERSKQDLIEASTSILGGSSHLAALSSIPLLGHLAGPTVGLLGSAYVHYDIGKGVLDRFGEHYNLYKTGAIKEMSWDDALAEGVKTGVSTAFGLQVLKGVRHDVRVFKENSPTYQLLSFQSEGYKKGDAQKVDDLTITQVSHPEKSESIFSVKKDGRDVVLLRAHQDTSVNDVAAAYRAAYENPELVHDIRKGNIEVGAEENPEHRSEEIQAYTGKDANERGLSAEDRTKLANVAFEKALVRDFAKEFAKHPDLPKVYQSVEEFIRLSYPKREELPPQFIRELAEYFLDVRTGKRDMVNKTGDELMKTVEADLAQNRKEYIDVFFKAFSRCSAK